MSCGIQKHKTGVTYSRQLHRSCSLSYRLYAIRKSLVSSPVWRIALYKVPIARLLCNGITQPLESFRKLHGFLVVE